MFPNLFSLHLPNLLRSGREVLPPWGEGGSLQAFLDGRAACREAFLSVLEGESSAEAAFFRRIQRGGDTLARRSRSSAPAEGVPDVRMAASSCLAHA